MGELDTKNGLRQLSEALLFLHRDAKLYHRFVDPCNVYITKDGDWKLGGLYYAVQVHSCALPFIHICMMYVSRRIGGS
jgi:serine/threonine protein kinase